MLALRALGVVAVVLALVLTTSAVSADADQRDRGQQDRGCQRSLSAGTQTIQVRFRGVTYPVRLVVPAGVSSRRSLPWCSTSTAAAATAWLRPRSAT